MTALLKKLWNDEGGQATVEYALVIGLIALGLIVALTAFRGQIAALLGRMGTRMDAVQAPE